MGKEIGYIYFQDFIPDNNFDTRITIIGSRAFAFRRNTRQGDFRASGSGSIDYNQNEIGKDVIKLAFEIKKKTNSQSVAFDFIYLKNEPLICEISYAYISEAVKKTNGYYDDNLNWFETTLFPEFFMIQDLIHDIEMKQK